MNRFFITTLLILCASTQLASVNAMKLAHEDSKNTVDLRTHSSASNLATTIKNLPPEMQLHAITWMLDVDTPESLLRDLKQLCACSKVDTHFASLLSDENLGYLVRTRLKNTGQTIENLITDNQETVLHLACCADSQISLHVIRVILNAAGAEVNKLAMAVDHNGLSALYYASHHGHTETVQALLTAPGVNPHQLAMMQDNTNMTALHKAAMKGHTEVVKTLLATPMVNAHQLAMVQDRNNCTALHHASYKGYLPIVQAIITAPGVDVQQLVKVESFNFHTALYWGNWKIKAAIQWTLLKRHLNNPHVGLIMGLSGACATQYYFQQYHGN